MCWQGSSVSETTDDVMGAPYFFDLQDISSFSPEMNATSTEVNRPEALQRRGGLISFSFSSHPEIETGY